MRSGDWAVTIAGEVVRVEREDVDKSGRNPKYFYTFVLRPIAPFDAPPGTTLPAEPAFRMPDDVWARIVYDFMLAYHQRVFNRDHLVSALAPLFSGWVASFVGELQDATPVESEERLERMCLRFESEKPYLISRWRWPDRFSP